MNGLLNTIRYRKLTNWSVTHLLATNFNYNENYDLVRLRDFLTRSKQQIIISDDKLYNRVTIRLYNKGVKLRDSIIGKRIGIKKQFIIKEGQFLLSKIDARNGAFGIAKNDVDKAIITADFFAYDIDHSLIDSQFLVLLTTTTKFQKFAQSSSSGTTGRQRIDERKFLDVSIPLPTLDKQREIIRNYNSKILKASDEHDKIKKLKLRKEEYLIKTLEVEMIKPNQSTLLSTVSFKDLQSWSIKDSIGTHLIKSDKYKTITLNHNDSGLLGIHRGKSPEYDSTSTKIILNQKCNRWNYIDLSHAKFVNEKWFNNIDKEFLTSRGDILINSTGEGTLGRATYINDRYEGLLFDSHILLLRLNKEKINPQYLTHFLNSSLGQIQIALLKSAIATKQTELGIYNCSRISIILPPLIKQDLLVKYLNDIDLEINALTESIEKNRKDAKVEFEKEIFNEAN